MREQETLKNVEEILRSTDNSENSYKKAIEVLVEAALKNPDNHSSSTPWRAGNSEEPHQRRRL